MPTARSRKRLYQTGSELEKARSTAAFAEQRLQELAASAERIASERAERDAFLAEAQSEKTIAAEKVALAREENENLRARSKEVADQISARNSELGAKRKEIAGLTTEQARLRATLSSLEEQKRRHEDSSKGVKAVFQQLLPKNDSFRSAVRGTLADILAVDKGYETAAEAALGRNLDLVLTSDASVHGALSEALRETASGRAAFADIQKLAAAAAPGSAFSAPAELAGEVAGPLADFVHLQAGADENAAALLKHLLADFVVVRSPAAAAALSALSPQHSFLTAEGELFRGGWYMEGGDKSSVSGSYVGRNREITELTEKAEQISHQIEALQTSLHEVENAIQALEGERREVEESLRAKQAEISQLVHEEAGLNARLNEAERALHKLVQEEQRFALDREKFQTSEKEARVQIFALETERGALEVEVSNLTQLLSENRAAWESAQQSLVDARVKATNLRDQKNTLDTRKRQNENALSQHRNRIENMLENARRQQTESEETNERIVLVQEEIVSLRSSLLDAEATYRGAKDRFDILNNEVEEQRSAAQDQGTRERAVKERLLNLRLDQQKVSSDRDLLAANTFEHYGITLADHSLLPETIEQVQMLRDAGDGVIGEIRNEVTLLKERIRKLGDVNPAAVEEYDQIVERYNLLSTQKADLEKAMRDLQDTVDRINRVSKDRFERAFAEVNAHFKRVFPVIFGGGHAHLTLTNPEDMLETGVDITAQPPGKKPQNINLLSGGEKTLTAISLLFSIFLVKPSPFCLLDEVDAPLDDANIGRFNALLREMSKRSQFIIITHNKRTMELNDKLYGVTMEDAGVSKMVSIQLSASA
jgi:chromosome segregation protein